MSRAWPLVLLMACSASSPPIETDPPSICGASFSEQCTVEEGFCMDPGPYVRGPDLRPAMLDQHRYWAEHVLEPNDFGFECWTYVARPCSDGHEVYTGTHDSFATLVDASGVIVGEAQSGQAWSENGGVGIAAARNYLYNGPREHLDCVHHALQEANALRRECNLYAPCDLDACIVDEVP